MTLRLFISTFQSLLKSIVHFYGIIEPELKLGICFIKYFEIMSFDDMVEERRWKREIKPIEDRSIGGIRQERPMGILTHYRSVRHNSPYQSSKSSLNKNLQNRFSVKRIVRGAIHGLFGYLVNLLPFPLPFLIRTVFHITIKYGFKLYNSFREDQMMRCSFSYMTTRIWQWVRNHKQRIISTKLLLKLTFL